MTFPARSKTHTPDIVPAADDDLSRGKLPDLLGYHLRRAQVFAFQSFAAALQKFGISPGQMGVLLLVSANPGINQTRVGQALGIDRSTLVAVIDRLEQRAYIVRNPSPSDRRSHALQLTPAGVKFLQQMMPSLDTHEAELARELSAAERAELIRLLGRVSAP